MHDQENDPEWHLNNSRTRKWLVQCVVCQTIGYRADAPKQFFGRYHLIKYFKPIQLDSTGVCEDCRKVLLAKL